MSLQLPSSDDRSDPDEPGRASKCIDWFHEGESKVVEVDGVRIIVRFIGRKGRRGRIAIEAPAGAVFRAVDTSGPERHAIRAT